MLTAQDLAHAAQTRGLRVAVAESLTSGMLSNAVGAAPGAGQWFAGGVVAYAMDVKTRVLGVPEGTDPCSPQCAVHLARGARDLLQADIAVSTTGVGGPAPDGDHLPGTVYVGWSTTDADGDLLLRLDGPPEEVISQTTAHAVDLLVTLARGDLPRE